MDGWESRRRLEKEILDAAPGAGPFGSQAEYAREFDAAEGRSAGPRVMRRILATGWIRDRLTDRELRVAIDLAALLTEAEKPGGVSMAQERKVLSAIQAVEVPGPRRSTKVVPWHPMEIAERVRSQPPSAALRSPKETGLPEDGPVPCPFKLEAEEP